MDKSLDEIIRSKKSARGRGGFRRGARGRGSQARGRGGRGGGAGGAGGGFKKAFSRQSTEQVQGKWQHDMFGQSPGGRGGRGGAGGIAGGQQKLTKLMISNLDYGVSTDDIKELFAEFGRVTKADVHFDKSGRSLGTATVFYTRYVDAKKAFDQYNNVPLDGRPMTVQIVSDQPFRQQATVNGSEGSLVKQRVGTRQQSAGGGGRPGGGRGGRGRGRGGRGAKTPVPTASELDAELDAYKQAESMES